MRRHGAWAQTAGRDEERKEGGLQQQIVPLETKERLADARKGYVHRPRADQAVAWCDVEDQAEAEHGADRQDSMESGITAIQPEQRGDAEERRGRTERVQVLLHRQQSLAAVEHVDLREQRQKSDQEGEPQEAEEQIAHACASRRLARLVHATGVIGAHLAAQPEAVAGDDAIAQIEHTAQQRDIVDPGQRCDARIEPQRARHGLGTATNAAVGLDQL